MQTLTPQMESNRNRWAHYMSSLARFDSEFIVSMILPKERTRIHAAKDEGTLTPGDMVYLRAALDTLEGRGIVNV